LYTVVTLSCFYSFQAYYAVFYTFHRVGQNRDTACGGSICTFYGLAEIHGGLGLYVRPVGD